MSARAVTIILFPLVLAACGSPQPKPAAVRAATVPSTAAAPQPTVIATSATVRLIPCDDGGSGGVMIDGVCL